MKFPAGIARWYLLALQSRLIEEANLILGRDSLSNIMKLLWKTRNRRFLSVLIPDLIPILGVIWVIINRSEPSILADSRL